MPIIIVITLEIIDEIVKELNLLISLLPDSLIILAKLIPPYLYNYIIVYIFKTCKYKLNNFYSSNSSNILSFSSNKDSK